MKTRNIFTVSLVAIILASCAPAATVVPTGTAVPTSTFTPAPTATITPVPPIEALSITQESVNQFANAMQNAGINITAEQILQQGLEIQIINGVDGKQYEFAFAHLDPDSSKQGESLEGNYPLMIKSDGGEWVQTTFKNIGDIVGINFGTTVNGAEDWHNPLYWQRTGEFQTITPNGYNVPDILHRLSSDSDYRNNIKELYKKGSVIRIHNLFYNSDHIDYSGSKPKPNLNDPIWKGAPEIGSPPSEEYKTMVREAMDIKIRSLFTQVPYITQIGFANEALWEYQGNTGWQDSPYYRAFGKDWLAEAYIRTYKIATQEFDRKPGKDLTLFYGDYNFIFANGKANFVFDVLSKTKAEIIKRAAAEGLKLPEAPFVVEEQGHINLSNTPIPGQFDISAVNEKTLEANVKKFSGIGPVWYGEITFKGGDRNERTEAAKKIIGPSINAGVRNFVFWELMQKNGMYADGDLLFDPNNSYENTSTTYGLFILLIENIKE